MRSLKILLEHGQNVDLMYGQGNGTGYRSEPVDPPLLEVSVASLEEASKVLRAWVERNGLGGGNMTQRCGSVTDGSKPIAHISYNGRIWPNKAS